MIKLMKYLKKSAGYVVLIIALLFLQAYCDLSLPDYTSKIVNVGIQQSGIEDSVPEKIRKTSMDNLKLFMDEEDKETIDSYYEEDGDNLVLKDDVKSEEREKLNDILAKPMMIAASFLSGSDEVNEMLAKMGVPEGTDPMQAIAQMPEEALASMIGKISEKIDKMQPSILTQAGVAYVKHIERERERKCRLYMTYGFLVKENPHRYVYCAELRCRESDPLAVRLDTLRAFREHLAQYGGRIEQSVECELDGNYRPVKVRKNYETADLNRPVVVWLYTV